MSVQWSQWPQKMALSGWWPSWTGCCQLNLVTIKLEALASSQEGERYNCLNRSRPNHPNCIKTFKKIAWLLASASLHPTSKYWWRHSLWVAVIELLPTSLERLVLTILHQLFYQFTSRHFPNDIIMLLLKNCASYTTAEAEWTQLHNQPISNPNKHNVKHSETSRVDLCQNTCSCLWPCQSSPPCLPNWPLHTDDALVSLQHSAFRCQCKTRHCPAESCFTNGIQYSWS